MARAMKDSGVEWIGEIPEEWDLSRMKNCITSRESGAWGDEPKGDDLDLICLRIADFDYARFRFKNSTDEELTKRHYTREVIDKLTLRKKDILIEKSGGGEKTPVGRTVLFDKDYPALYANFMDRLRCKDTIAPEFMQYIFVTFYKNEYTRNYIKQTTGIQNLDLTAMLSSEQMPTPPLDEQARIADFLDRRCAEIDRVVSETEKTIEEYKALKQSIITEAVTKGIHGERPMKPSGIEWIGEIPEEWDKDKVVRLFKTIGSGTTPKSSDDEAFSGNINWIQSGDINGGYLNECKNSVNDETLKQYSALKVYIAPFIIIAMYGASIGNISISTIDGCVNQACCVLSNSIINFDFAFYAIKAAKEYLIRKADGGGQPNISQDKIKALWLPIPPNTEQAEIISYLNEKCSEIEKLISAKQQLLTELESYKKSLIYEYVTGKKEVPSCR